MQTATNPETGEVAVLVGGAWKKADRVASNDKGEKAYLVGGQWLSKDGPANLPVERKRGLGEDLVRQLGLTVRAGAQGVTALPNMIGDAFGLNSTKAVSDLLTNIGLPNPENSTERVSQDVAGALAGTGGLARIAQFANPAGIGQAAITQLAAPSTGPVGQSVARSLSENLGTQATAAAAASGASGTTRELGGGPGSQLMAGLAAGVGVPLAAQTVLNAPRNAIARSILKSEEKEFAKEGGRLAVDTGIDLTLGQRTGNRLALGMENAARQYGPLADRVQDLDVKIAKQAIDRVTTIADKISSKNLDPATLGTSIEDTVKGATRHMDKLRDFLANKDYGKVRELAGNQPVIRFDNFSDELGKIIEQFKNVPAADAQKITAQAKAALDRVTGIVQQATPQGSIVSAAGAPLVKGQAAQSGPLLNTIDEAMKARSFYGKAARGSANVFEDVAPDMNRALASRLFGAINRDFDQSSQNASGALRSALDHANKRFKNITQSMEFLEKSTLGKLVGDDIADAAINGAKVSTTAGEQVIQRLMSAHPSSRKTAMDILGRWNPEIAKETRAFVLRDALDKGMSIPPSSKGAGQVPISFSKFVSALQGEKVGFDKQLQSYGFSASEVKDIKDTVAAMMRAGDRTGYNFSGTNVQAQNMEVAGAVGQGLMGNVKESASKLVSIGGKYLGLKKFADAMESHAGRQAIKTLVSPKASPQAVIAAFETVNGTE